MELIIEDTKVNVEATNEFFELGKTGSDSSESDIVGCNVIVRVLDEGIEI